MAELIVSSDQAGKKPKKLAPRVTRRRKKNQLPTLSPKQHYEQLLHINAIAADPIQKQAIDALDTIWLQLMDRFAAQKNREKPTYKTVPQGLYMWGGVGRGKSWLMDHFFAAVPFRRKMRMHFHHFLQRIHKDLNALTGKRDRLEKVADHLHQEALLICFDEFYVSNVADAMILGELFNQLFARGVTLVATSNIEPDLLYLDGINRDLFLPVIDNIKHYCTVMQIDSGIDYRLKTMEVEGVFRTPLTVTNEAWLANYFDHLSELDERFEGNIEINHHQLKTLGYSSHILWANFNELCVKPRSPADYIELANRFEAVLLSDIPAMIDRHGDAVRRFIYLVDEFYDRKIKLAMTADANLDALYTGTKFAFEFQRTYSRLIEMQSKAYLADQKTNHTIR